MNNSLNNITNKELIQIYRMILEHLEFIQNEKKKLEEEESK